MSESRASSSSIAPTLPETVALPPADVPGVCAQPQRAGGALRVWLRAMRLRQWPKNVLVFAPLAAAHRLHDGEALALLGLAFIAFGLCASAGYIGNDLRDRDADRAHPRKCRRPFAARELSPAHGLVVMLLLAGAGLLLAFAIAPRFAAVLAGYCAATAAYSLWLKRIRGLDVLLLAALYGLRIVAGGVVAGVSLSYWLMGFALVLFLSLAMLKRYTELGGLAHLQREWVPGRGYHIQHMGRVWYAGIAAGVAAAAVLALYAGNAAARALYSRPALLWLLCPVLLCWLAHVWAAARRGAMHDDPVVFALRDRGSWLFAATCGLVLLAAL